MTDREETPTFPALLQENDPEPFKASPWLLRVIRHRRRWARWQFARLMFLTNIWNPDESVGAFNRVRDGVAIPTTVTRFVEEQGRYFVKPPNEWAQDEADAAIVRGQELARKYGWDKPTSPPEQ